MAKVKRQFGEATDTAGALARAMEQAYRLGFEDAARGPTATGDGDATKAAAAPDSDALNWTLIPARTRSTFWSLCLAALGREGRTRTPAYLVPESTRRGTLAWRHIVPDRPSHGRIVGDGAMVTMVRLGLLEASDDGARRVLADFGIRTWNEFCKRGGHWPDDFVEKLP